METTFESRIGQPFAKKVGGIAVSGFEKISDAHGRNLTESASSKRAVWTGEYLGDIFGARSVKGASTSDAYLEEGENGEYDVRAHGLTDDVALPRLLRASDFLRKNGLPTEAIRSVSDLTGVRVKGKEIPIDEWEKEELERVKNEFPDLYGAFKTFLKETKFIVIERDVQVDERIRDLKLAHGEKRLKEFMAPIFKWLNVATASRNSGIISGTPRPDKFDDTAESFDRYFESYLPSQMGIYLGRLHKLGVIHGSSHDQNWSVVGTLYDADTISGKPIFSDDDSPTAADFEADVWTSLETINSLNEDLGYAGELKSQSLFNFIKNYLLSRFGKIDSRGVDLIKGLSHIDNLDEVRQMLKVEAPR